MKKFNFFQNFKKFKIFNFPPFRGMKLFKKENVEFQKALELSDKLDRADREETERLSVYKSDGEGVEDKDSCNKLKECET